MIVEYKIDNGFKANAKADIADDTRSALAPLSKFIININLFIKYEPACLT